MAFYELHINCYLKISTPIEILDTLLFMILKNKPNIPDFVKTNRIELFNNPNWAMFLKDDVKQFPIIQFSELQLHGDRYILSIHSSFMSKDEGLTNLFLDFIEPYVYESDDFIGYYRKPNDSPKWLYYKNNKIELYD